MRKINIFVTLGPSSLNKDFLKYINGKVSLVRLNMSHVGEKDLKRQILFIKKNCKIPICIDTEGAQIRTKLSRKKRIKYFKKNIIFFNKLSKDKNFYPPDVFDKLKIKDILDIGFEGLKIKIIGKTKNKIKAICINQGFFENNKGVHIINRKVKLNYLTKKDLQSIKIAKKLKIKNYALSFTNSISDIKNFSKLLPREKKIFKIETLEALKNINLFFKIGNQFLIDRGDLSKDIGIENIPFAQRKIFSLSKKIKKIKIAVATNFLESMIEKPFPTRAEVNDIYNSIEMGTSSLVLAGETAIGKYPKECIDYLLKIIKIYHKDLRKNFKY